MARALQLVFPTAVAAAGLGEETNPNGHYWVTQEEQRFANPQVAHYNMNLTPKVVK